MGKKLKKKKLTWINAFNILNIMTSLYHYYIYNKSINLNYDLKQFVSEFNSKNVENAERDEIRQKLAALSSSSSSSSFAEFYLSNENNNNSSISDSNNFGIINEFIQRNNQNNTSHKPSSSVSSGSSYSSSKAAHQNLQICFMNDAIINEQQEEGLSSGEEDGAVADSSIPVSESFENFEEDGDGDGLNKSNSTNSLSYFKVSSKALMPISLSNFNLKLVCTSNGLWNLVLTQLQYETKRLLAFVPEKVRERVEAEVRGRRKVSPLADIVGLSAYGLRRIERVDMIDMNIGQLQVVVNDFCNKIESSRSNFIF